VSNLPTSQARSIIAEEEAFDLLWSETQVQSSLQSRVAGMKTDEKVVKWGNTPLVERFGFMLGLLNYK
jgi:hypothetical protein